MYRLLFLLLLRAPAASADEVCRPTNVDEALIHRTIDLLGIDSTRVLHFGAGEYVMQEFQSERTYPPFFSLVRKSEIWFSNGVQRTQSEFVYPGYGPNPTPPMLSDDRRGFVERNGELRPVPGGMGADVLYLLNPWGVVPSFRDAKLTEECLYRDFPRAVFTRDDGMRLYVDPKTGFPVKVERTEPHYLWGQVRAEYLYSLWDTVEGSRYPRASYRLVEGSIDISRTVGKIDFLPREEAPSLTLPEGEPPAAPTTPLFLQPLPPDTVRVAQNAYLLTNPGYTEAVALVHDTVFVFDATQSAERARLDHEWIRKLFPGEHPIVVVVTDLAWPHIAGVRYWVAQGATIVSHRMSEEFLQKVVGRKWTLEPDVLEKQRRPLIFRGIDGPMTTSGVRIVPIDGIGSEGALMAYLPESEFLWAGDFIQTLDSPASYTTEVWTAAQREGIRPKHVAAQHLPLSSWEKVEEVVR